MPLSLAIAILFTLFCSSTRGAEPSKTLLGRWCAETVPTGYWIVERHPDGRFAEKAFLVSDYNKPAEIAFTWGRWKLRGKRYLTIIDGSSSAFVRHFTGKWKATIVVKLSSSRFDYLSSEGYPRYELRYPGT